MEGIRGFQHPLEAPVILDHIFKNLDTHDLQVCREVCRTWRQESGKAMRVLVKVEIQCVVPNPRGPSEFLELVRNRMSTFFQAPFAEEFALKDGDADCPEFWERCGGKIKRLRLDCVTFSSADAFRYAVFQCSPNLEKLEMEDVKVLGKPTSEPNEWVAPQFTQNRNLKSLSLSFNRKIDFSVSKLEILSQFPCLEKLHAITVNGIPGNFESLFRALEVARQHDASCWKLTEVKFDAGLWFVIPVPPSFARVFGDGSLTLTSLSIQGIATDVSNVTTVQKILVAQAHSLKKLEIKLNRNDFREMDIFPLPGNQVLENVATLNLTGMKIRSTGILQAFPNLKKLMLVVCEILEDTQTPHVTLENCTQLILSGRMGEIDEFNRLFGVLPNLKKLKVQHLLGNERFSLICESWPNLTHLELIKGHFSSLMVDDAGISGYDREDVVKINQRRGLWRPITVRRANLSSLKNLQSISCRFSFGAHLTVGYCSEACGILELPNLKQLRMGLEKRTGNGFETVFVPMFESLSEQFPWDVSQEITID